MITNVTGTERKALVKAIAAHIGEKEKYLGVPSCAYRVGPFTITKDGAIDFADDTDQELIRKLCDALAEVGIATTEMPIEGETADQKSEVTPQEATTSGQESEEAAEGTDTEIIAEEAAEASVDAPKEEETDTLTVSLPMSGHTAGSLRNLISMVFSRGKLITKATGGNFSCTEALATMLNEGEGFINAEGLRKAVADFETENSKALTGISFTGDKVAFTFPMTEDPEKVQAFQQLACQMCKLAKEQKRTLAREVDDSNEKYIFRIWLLRLGMAGADFKIARRVLLAQLSGNAAFKDQAMEDRWKVKQAEKRNALKAAKAAADTEAGKPEDSKEEDDNERAE